MWRSESVCGISDSTNGPFDGLKQAKGGHAEGRPNQGPVTLTGNRLRLVTVAENLNKTGSNSSK
jgi:hypothetical protein